MGELAGQTVIRGVIKDAASGDPLAYASIVVSGAQVFTQSNFEGEFELKWEGAIPCSLRVHMVGYVEVLLIIKDEKKLSIYLKEEVFQLE